MPRPGDAVWTQYGAGVVVEAKESAFVVRLWRRPGQSLASAARAILRPEAVLEVLPVVPGMVSEWDGSRVMVESYSAVDQTFTVTVLDQQDPSKSSHVVPRSELKASRATKFAPLLETLMVRGDGVATMAATHLSSLSTSAAPVVNTNASIDQITAKAQELAPQADESLHQVLKLVKDEELTVLLRQCQDRLQQLVSQKDLASSTQQALEQAGIVFQVDERQEQALQAVQKLLNNPTTKELPQQLTQALDSLASSARSDPSLRELMELVSEKTTEWQMATGKVLQTRSAGLFLEGAGRLQARALALLQKQQWAGDLLSGLTKSFTEGDAALARLKSIELGENVKRRLVEAIEVRSESIGGLDGIIAGALSKGDGSDIKGLLNGLQTSASSAATNANETLLSVLSQRSTYRDVALLRIESVLCDLESQFDGELSPEDIAALARGEGGTAKLFEPIAKRAMTQIDKQLEVAENQVDDKTVLEVLSRVRKLMSGELTVSAVSDDVASLLNDDKIVAASETIVVHSENVLDALEGVSTHKAFNDAIQIAEKAGITKDTVMKELEKLDVNAMIDTAGTAVSDDKARRRLISTATDAALDFVLKVLPSMPVPPFEGVKDGLLYQISNLSMEGFKVRKEDIQIELAGLRATKRRRSSVVEVANGLNEIPQIQSTPSLESMESTESIVEVEESGKRVKATELLIIDIRHISALLDGAKWGFEQTYLPYLKGEGTANVRMSEGSIRLQFELRRRRKAGDPEAPFEPVLCLHDRACTIGGVDLNLDGEGRLTWVLNKLASIFKGPLRDYVVRTIVNVLTSRSGWILERLNSVLTPYWDLILKTAKLSLVSRALSLIP